MDNNNRNEEFNDYIDYFNSSNENNENTGFKVNADEFDISSNDSDDLLDLNSYYAEEGLDIDNTDISSYSSFSKKNIKNTLLGFIQNKSKKITLSKAFKIAIAVFMVFVIVACAGAGTAVGYIMLTVDGTMEEDLTALKLNYSTTIYAKNSSGNWVEYQRLHGGENRIWVPYDKDKAAEFAEDYEGIPHYLAMAFVAIEDKRFFDHEGVDWRRTISAFVNMLTNRTTSGYGGSSITQQLVKNLTKDQDRSASRKVREIMRARYLESNYTKEVILECYMNTIAMGNGIYGVEVAAEYYYGKKVSELTLAECASIAGITNIPEYYRPDKNPENNLERRNLVLKLMYEQKLITTEEYEAAKAEEMKVVGDKSAIKESSVNNYFVDALIDDVVTVLMDKYGWDKNHAEANFYNSGYKIYSTVDPEVQSVVDSVYSDPQYTLTGKNGASLQGSMVIMDYSGHVVGLAGGMGTKTENRGLNRATMSPRQPGSTIKPISAYALAIEKDVITYSSIVDDALVYYNNKTWRPTNWYNYYKGKVTVKYALEISMNTIPVYLCDRLTLQSSYDFLTKDLGIKNLNQNDIAYAPLGMGGTNGGLTTLESAAAFAIFGNGGKYYSPITFTEIYDQFDNLVYSQQPKMNIAISEDTATIMNHLLQNVVNGAEGTGAGARGFVSMPMYAKTGTANSTNDIWFVGGTPYYVASSWCGYDTVERISDAKRARKMWGAVMSKIHKGKSWKNFKSSSRVQCKLFCSETGLLANTGCPINSYGWYKTSDQTYCSTHAGANIEGTTIDQANTNLAAYKKDVGVLIGQASDVSKPTESKPNASQNQTSNPTTSSKPVTSEPTTSQPVTSEPTTSQPATSEPTTSQEPTD